MTPSLASFGLCRLLDESPYQGPDVWAGLAIQMVVLAALWTWHRSMRLQVWRRVEDVERRGWDYLHRSAEVGEVERGVSIALFIRIGHGSPVVAT